MTAADVPGRPTSRRRDGCAKIRRPTFQAKNKTARPTEKKRKTFPHCTASHNRDCFYNSILGAVQIPFFAFSDTVFWYTRRYRYGFLCLCVRHTNGESSPRELRKDRRHGPRLKADHAAAASKDRRPVPCRCDGCAKIRRPTFQAKGHQKAKMKFCKTLFIFRKINKFSGQTKRKWGKNNLGT